MKAKTPNLILLGVAALAFLACCMLATLTGIAGLWITRTADWDFPTRSQRAALTTPTAMVAPPGPRQVMPVLPTAALQPRRTPEPSSPDGGRPTVEYLSTEDALRLVVVPTRDLRDLALRLRPEVDEIPLVVNAHAPDYPVGTQLEFWVSNADENSRRRITAELFYKTAVVYAWVETGQQFDRTRMAEALERFSTNTYPLLRDFFGSEWQPGVDNDPRLHILHATGLGRTIAGYYSSADQFSALANPYSNEKEMFYISLEGLNHSGNFAFYETVLAHEFQHMIHWANDRNEETWVNEGLSELAQEIAGFPPDTVASDLFASRPDTQLNTWSSDPQGRSVHYGNSYLFMAYFYQRFGPELLQSVVMEPANGVAGFNRVLAVAGEAFTFDDIFADWVIANYVDDPDALGLEQIYGYRTIAHPTPALDQIYRRYPVRPRTTDVYNYAADYIALEGSGDIDLHFQGNTVTSLAPLTAYSGTTMWWSNRTDDGNSRLTRAFDLSEVAAGSRVTMEVAMWWQIEADYDYGYALVSVDGGTKWFFLESDDTTRENPSGGNFGAAFTGSSSSRRSRDPEWVVQRFDLSPYSGQPLLVRFEYVTDDAVTEPGWFIDDISIAALGYQADFEDGLDGWISEGWVLTDNRLTQRWLLQLMQFDAGRLVEVSQIPVDTAGYATVPVNGLGGDRTAVLAISGVTPFTTEPAPYTYQIERRTP